MNVDRLRHHLVAWLSMALLPVFFFLVRSSGAEPTAEAEFITRNWDVGEGLPTGNITVLARTPDGFLWLGTPAGLVRFDGVGFRTFSPGNTPALTGARITALLVDHTGTLWIGTGEGGMARYQTNTFTAVSLDSALPRGGLLSFTEDRSGTIWGIVERQGVFSWHNGQTAFYNTNSGLPDSLVWGIVLDTQDRRWADCRGHLMQFHNDRWSDAAGLPRDFPRLATFASARDGGLWLACPRRAGSSAGDRGNRIFKYANDRVTEMPGLPCNQDSRRSLPRLLLEDHQGTIWCLTRGAGIFFWADHQWRLFSDTPSLAQVQAACLAEDEHSVLWLGMDGTGLYQVRPRSITALELPPGFPSSCFWTVCASRDGAIWGGTDGDGVFRWQNGVATHWQHEQGLTNEHVNALLEDRGSKIWAGTMGGLFRLDGGRFEPMTGVGALRLPVFALKEDRVGRLWAGTSQGLVQIDHESITVFGPDQGLPFGPINAIEEDYHGRLWISVPPTRDQLSLDPAGPYGLYVKSNRGFEQVAPGKWAGAAHIRSLYADGGDNLWIGTIGTGVYRLHGGNFTGYSLDDGLPQERIQAIMADSARNLWFCSEAGVFGCPTAQLEGYVRGSSARLSWWQIQRSDGLPSRLTTGNGQPSAARAADGRIWLADAGSIAGFDPQAVRKTERLRPPVITDILVNGVPQAPTGNHRLRLAPGARSIEICYASPNLTTSAAPAFWTRLKGFNPDWVRGGMARVASYNLQPGDYEFAVAVTGPDGSRLETASPLNIEVTPQFWERGSVRVLAGLLVVTGVALGVRGRERARLRQRLRQLEIQRTLDQVRQRIARDIHDDLGSGLTEITLLSDNLTWADGDAQASRQAVRRIGECARALTHEMDEVVWAINPQTDSLESLATYLNDFAQERLALAGIRCRLNTGPELPDLRLSSDIRHSLYRAAREVLNNAIKYSGATEVAVSIDSKAGDLSLLIQDNGCGFDPHQPFKRGNGLKFMQQRLAEIGGRCEVVSRVGAGTTVCFTIPGATNRLQPPAPNDHPFPS